MLYKKTVMISEKEQCCKRLQKVKENGLLLFLPPDLLPLISMA